MPVYAYRCQACDATFDLLVRGGTVPACPQCGSTSLEKQVSAAFVSSGQATRPVGQTCCGREERCSTPPCSEGGTCWRE